MEYISFEEVVGLYRHKESLESIIKSIYNYRDQNTISDGSSNVDGWQKELPETPEFCEIRDIIMDNFPEYLDKLGITDRVGFTFTKFFCNVNPPGASNTMHSHNVGEFSGAFWLKAEENSGDIIIMNPYRNSMLNTLCTTNKNYNCMKITPESNLGCFFNSNLIHYVDVNRSNTDRISIAFHIKIL